MKLRGGHAPGEYAEELPETGHKDEVKPRLTGLMMNPPVQVHGKGSWVGRRWNRHCAGEQLEQKGPMMTWKSPVTTGWQPRASPRPAEPGSLCHRQ